MLISRFIYRQLAVAITVTVFTLVALFVFFDLLKELSSVGEANYTFTTALVYELLLAPTYAYEVAPISLLIGAVLVFSQMALRSEYVVLRTSGFSTFLALRTVLVFGMLASVVAFALGEWLAPYAFERGQQLRLQAYGTVYAGKFKTGVWLKDVEGDTKRVRVLNIGHFSVDQTIHDISIYILNEKSQLMEILKAERGSYARPGFWRLEQVVSSDFALGHGESEELDVLEVSELPVFELDTDITPEILSSLYLEPERMSLQTLYSTISHLQEARQDSGRYQVSFWRRLCFPLSFLTMLVLALPFAYASARGGALGNKIFWGIVLGVLFVGVDALVLQFGFLQGWPPFLVVLAAPFCFSLFSVLALWRIERR